MQTFNDYEREEFVEKRQGLDSVDGNRNQREFLKDLAVLLSFVGEMAPLCGWNWESISCDVY